MVNYNFEKELGNKYNYIKSLKHDLDKKRNNK